MAKVMRIGLVPAGTTPQAPSYTIDCGYVNYQGWDSTWYRDLQTSDVYVSDATPINSIVNSGSVLGDFDCYINGVIDEQHKLGFKLYAYDTHAIIYNEEIGSFINVHRGQNSEGNCYLVFNNYVSSFNYGTDTIETMADLRAYMAKVVQLGNPILPVGIRTRGMNTNDSAVLSIISENGDHYQDSRWYGGEGTKMGTSYYNNLTGPFNWYKLMTGDYATEAPYVETVNGDKIYMSVSKGSTAYINDHLLYDLNTPVFPFYDEYGKPCVSAFYQSGTDLTHLVKQPGDEVELKNGSKIKYLAVKGEDDYYHYYIELSYDDGENHYSILSAINFYSNPYSDTSAYMPDGHLLSHTTISDKMLNGIEYYKTTGGTNNGNSVGLIGAYLWLSPNVHGSIYDYIEQHNQLPPEPRSFWNNYPSTPATIGFVTKDLFTRPSTDVDGNNTTATTRSLAFTLPFIYQYNYNNYAVYRDILATNLVGRYLNNVNYHYTMGTTIGVPDTIINDLYLTAGRGGGEMNVESAIGAARLLGADAQYSQEEPDDDYDSLGDNAGTEPTGGEGEFDDSTTTIPDSTPTGGATSKVLNMFYIGLTGSSDYLDEMQHMCTWINDTNVFNSFEERVQGIISLKDIYTWSVSDWANTARTEIKIRGKNSEIMGHNIGYGYEIQTKTLGSYTIKAYYDDFLDYAPHTSVKIYLPFSGTYDLDPSLVVGGTITLNAKLNLISGDILYTIQVYKQNKKDPSKSLNAVIYSFNGNTSGELPITSTDYSNKLSSMVNTGLGAVATMGALATGTAAGFVAAGAHTLMSEAAMLKQNGNSRTTGFTGGSVGKLGVLRPYLIITRPRRVKAQNYGSVKGFPSMASVKLSGIDNHLEGYIKVHQCNWSIPGATKSEVEAIDRLMKTEGAIL